jgi:hypothetical protein
LKLTGNKKGKFILSAFDNFCTFSCEIYAGLRLWNLLDSSWTGIGVRGFEVKWNNKVGRVIEDLKIKSKVKS